MADKARAEADLIREVEDLRQRAESAEASLLSTTATLRSFMESATDGFLLLDSDLRVVDVTHRDISGLGIAPETIVGKSIEQVSPGFQVEGRLEEFREVIRTGNPFFVRDFSPAWPPAWRSKHLSQKVFKVGDGAGVVITDITDMKRAETELRQSEALYRLLAENVTDVIWTVDGAGRLTYVSPSVKHLLGYDPAEVWNQPAFAFVSSSRRKELRRSLRRYLERSRQAASGASESFSVELELVRKAGDSVWSETILSGLRVDDGNPSRIVGVTRDIRERRQAQELFQTLADNSPIGVYVARKGRLIFVNKQFAEYVKRSSDELMDLETSSFILPEDRSMARKNAVGVLKGRSQSPYVFRYVVDGGQVRWAMERLTSVSLYGEPAVVGNLMDITKTKEDEEALRRSEHELRLLSQRILEVQDGERSYIARELHDQLGQQIFVLKMEIGRLLEHPPEPSSLQTRILTILGFVDRLQSTCRAIAVGLTPAPYEQLGLRAAIQLCAEEFERRSGISCPVHTAACDPPLSRAANSVVRRVLQEALLNVWRHAQAMQVNVRLIETDDSVLLEVADDGIGFDSSEMRDPALLGLRGMQQRARLQGGCVDIESYRGLGTLVRLRLPFSESKGESSDRPE